MTVTVSISQLREDLSAYISRVQSGESIVVKDEKKGIEVAEITSRKQFDPEAYKAMLDRVAGSISAKDHPEWATPAKISRWLRRTRKQSERHFDVPPRH